MKSSILNGANSVIKLKFCSLTSNLSADTNRELKAF